MDEQSKAALAEITAKEPAALNENEIAFLRARRDYLTEVEKDRFAEFLIEEAKADEEPKKAKKAKADEEQ